MTKLDNRFMPDPAVTSILRGSSAASGTLKLGSTGHATKGSVYLGEAMNGVIVDETTNYVGIGIAPTSPIHFQPVAATTAIGQNFVWTPTSTSIDQTGQSSTITYTPGSSSIRSVTGHKVTLTSAGANATTGTLLAASIRAIHGHANTCAKLWGLQVTTSGDGIVTNTITDMRGIMLSMGSNTGQTVTTSYGIYLSYTFDQPTATHYAIYTETPPGVTTDYGLYLKNTYNFLQGRLGIGSASLPPAHTLDVYASPISTNGMYVGSFAGVVTISSGSGGFLRVNGTLGANSSPAACSLYGANVAVTTDGATTLANHTIFGASVSATSAVASNHPVAVYGLDVTAAQTATGTLALLEGIRLTMTVSAGVCSAAYGMYIYAPTGGTLGAWTGIRIQGRSALGTNDIGIQSEASMNRFSGRVVVGSGGINTVGMFHVCYDGSGLKNQGAYCSFGESNSYAPAMMAFEVTSGDPYFGWNVLQAAGDDTQAYYKTDSAFRLTHDISADLLILQHAASGTAGNAITWANTLQVNTSGRVFFGTAAHPGYSATVAIREPTSGNAALIMETNDASGGYPNVKFYQYRGTTTNAVATNVAAHTLTDSMSFGIVAYIFGRRTGGTAGAANDAAFYVVRCLARKATGAVTLTNVLVNYTGEHQAAWNATLVASAGTIVAQVTGALNNNVSWYVMYQIVEGGA